MTRRSAIAAVGSVLALAASAAAASAPVPSAAQAQPAAGAPTPGGRTPVFQNDLPDLALSGWAVTAIEVNYKPGQTTPPHHHPGLTFAYVLEGEVRSKVGDASERVYRTGEMWMETPNQIHAVSGNASDTKPARLLAILLARKGDPLTTMEKP